ncbi:hypothetical protein ACN38_g1711 [Penicillium nordicum]|uniref:Uncharacterized protein n=1 Tax=Penicillium nordicum TaxID=229535 RepID=A0A0M9WJL4_9EURO|nr:hypothetical protein ACN38_g1711 [Penicillium nordicum]
MGSFRLMICTRYYGFYTNIETHRFLSPSTNKDVSSVQTDRYTLPTRLKLGMLSSNYVGRNMYSVGPPIATKPKCSATTLPNGSHENWCLIWWASSIWYDFQQLGNADVSP